MTMAGQTEAVSKAFEQVFEDFRKITESTVKVQQDLLHQWTAMWPGCLKPLALTTDQLNPFQKEWTQALRELTGKYEEVWDQQYKAAMKSLEGALRLSEAKGSTELRQEMVQLWQKSFDCLKDLAQTQMQNFKTAVEKWMELAKKANP